MEMMSVRSRDRLVLLIASPAASRRHFSYLSRLGLRVVTSSHDVANIRQTIAHSSPTIVVVSFSPFGQSSTLIKSSRSHVSVHSGSKFRGRKMRSSLHPFVGYSQHTCGRPPTLRY